MKKEISHRAAGVCAGLHGQGAELSVASIPFQSLEPTAAALPRVLAPCQAEPRESTLSGLFLGHEYADGAFCSSDSAGSCPQPDSSVALRCSVLPRTWQPSGKSGCCSPSRSSPISSTAAGNHSLPCPSAENRCTDPPKHSRAHLPYTTDFPGH